MIEEAQPQTIEAEDGFPIDNPKFCGSFQEVMAVIQKNKPMTVTSIKYGGRSGNFIMEFIKNGRKIIKKADCNKFTYEQIYNESKNINLVYYPDKKYDKNTVSGLFFFKENMKDAYILWELFFGGNNFVFDITTEEEYNHIVNIIIGILLGYKKKDIRAWFVMGLEHEFNMRFNNLDQRDEFIKKPEFKKRRDEIAAKFESDYPKAIEKLNQIREKVTVPSEWETKLKTLEPPPQSFFQRLFGKKTAGRKLKYKKTLRKRKHY